MNSYKVNLNIIIKAALNQRIMIVFNQFFLYFSDNKITKGNGSFYDADHRIFLRGLASGSVRAVTHGYAHFVYHLPALGDIELHLTEGNLCINVYLSCGNLSLVKKYGELAEINFQLSLL